MRNISELNGLRGIAVLAVFFHHACYASFGSVIAPGWNTAIQALAAVSKYGDSGVDLFFVLSGFLITSIQIGKSASPAFYRDFYWKRLLRIGPVLMLALVVTLILHEFRYALVALFLLGNFAYQLHAVGTAPFWSLAIEEQFYLLWPTAIRKTGTGTLRWLAVILIVGCAALRFVFAAVGHDNYRLTFLRVDTLAMGALLAILLHENRSRTLLSWLIASSIIGGTLCLGASAAFGGTYFMPIRELGIGLISFSIVAVSVYFTGCLMLAPLRSRLLLLVAEISYAMYLLHLFVFRAYDNHFGIPAVGNNYAYWTRLVVLFAGSTGVAFLSRYAIELPVLNLRKYVLSDPRVIDPATEPPLPVAQM